MSTYVNHQTGRDNQTRESKPIAHFLHDHTSGSEGWRCDIRSTVVVEYTAHDDIDGCKTDLAGDKGTRELLGLSHLGHDREECWGTRIGEDDGRNGRDGRPEVRVADDFEVRDPGNDIFGGIDRAILHPDRNNDDNNCSWYESRVSDRGRDREGKDILSLQLTGGDNARHTTPCHPGNLPQCLDASKPEPNGSRNGDEASRTDGVRRQSVETNRHAQHARTCDKDPVYTR